MIDTNTPEIRFEGFLDDWAIDTLGVLTDVYDGTHQTPTYTESGIMFLSVENIKAMTSSKYISTEAFNNDFKVYPQKGDVLMTRMGDIGTANIVESDNPLAYYVSLALLKKKSLNPYFLKSVIQTEAVWRELWHRTLHIAFPRKINIGEIKKVIVNYPVDDKEQTAIGDFFRNLDDIITLKKQQHDNTQNVKKAMLEKMFPKKGADVPEIRFEGFSRKWKRYNFFDTISKVIDFRGRTPKKLGMDWSDIGYLALSALNVKNGYIDLLADANYGGEELYQKWMAGNELRKGQVLFTTEAPMGNIAQIPDDRKYILSQRTIAFNLNENIVTDDFFATLLRTNIVFDELTALSSGGTAKGVSQKSMEQLSIVVPHDIDEQTAIGNFFRNLDTLIEAERQGIDKLQNIKKACLSKMFV